MAEAAEPYAKDFFRLGTDAEAEMAHVEADYMDGIDHLLRSHAQFDEWLSDHDEPSECS